MAKAAINRLTNANIYIDGNSFLGKAMSIDLPSIEQKVADHEALGMVGVTEFFAGIDKMEATINWSSVYPDVMAILANPTKSVNLQCRSSLESWESQGKTAEVPVVCAITGTFKKLPMGNFKQHENVELESSLTVHYLKLTINNVNIVEIDVLANIYKVNGTDILANYRANLGID